MSTRLTAQERVLRSVPEADLEANVAGACKQLRLRYYHTHRSQHSPAGWPDDAIIGPSRMLYRELKREDGQTSEAQEECLTALAAIGQDVGIWRPSDWASGLIAAELLALRDGRPPPPGSARR